MKLGPGTDTASTAADLAARLSGVSAVPGVMQQAQSVVPALRRGDVVPAVGAGLGALAGAAGIAAGVMAPEENALTDVVQGNKLVVPGIRAFHGSPHDFEAFDLSKIGRGEGAQAYGHGLYFAGNEGVARSYRDKLSTTPIDALGLALSDFQPYKPAGLPPTTKNIGEMLAAHSDPYLRNAAANPQVVSDIAAMVSGHDLSSGTWNTAATQAASRLDTYFTGQTSGKMYEVNLGVDPEHLLDWDRPLSQQSDYVKNTLGVPSGKMPTGADVTRLMQIARDRGVENYKDLPEYADLEDQYQAATRLAPLGINLSS